MRSFPTALGFVLALIAISPVRAGQLDSLSWLTGCWDNPQGEAGSGEYWLPLAGGTMLGIGKTVRNGKTVEYEFLRLHADAEGRAVYTATPSGQQETSFIASRIGEATATFENPSHDFPQRITYTKVGQRRMVVRIEGQRAGKLRAVDFQFAKVSCPS